MFDVICIMFDGVTGDRFVSLIWMMFDVGCMREDVLWMMDDG